MAERSKPVITIDADPAMRSQPAGNIRNLFQIYVRVLAALYVIMGLVHWTTILGITKGPDLLHMLVERRMSEVFFAVADLVAAVGLWLLSSWGVVVWMAAAIVETSLNVVLPNIYGFDPLVVGFNVVSIVFYIIFTYTVGLYD